MTNSFLDEIFEALSNDSDFSSYELLKSYQNTHIKYPITHPYVTFGMEEAQTDTLILGADDCEIFSENMTVTVAVNENSGISYCEKVAEDICTAIIRLDSEKMITSVSMGKGSYDKSIFGYRIIMKFGLRETGICFGGE